MKKCNFMQSILSFFLFSPFFPYLGTCNYIAFYFENVAVIIIKLAPSFISRFRTRIRMSKFIHRTVNFYPAISGQMSLFEIDFGRNIVISAV